MPLVDLGYRSHDGSSDARRRWFGWLPIATEGVRLVYRGTWLRRTMVLTLLPAVVSAAIIFALEQMDSTSRGQLVRSQMLMVVGANEGSTLKEPFLLPEPLQRRSRRGRFGRNEFRRGDLRPGDMASDGGSNPDAIDTTGGNYDRAMVWRLLLANYFRYPQSFVMLLLVGLIAPRLISFDYRSRGYLLYFSRPIGIAGYLMGKQCVVWFFVSVVTTLSALLVYAMGLAASPNLSVFWDTWDLPLRILAASVVLIVPTTLVALLMSAMTVESRYAAFGWFAFWTLGWVAYASLRLASVQIGRNPGGAGRRATFGMSGVTVEDAVSPWLTLFSPYHTLGRVQYWVFGLTPLDRYVVVSIIAIVVVAIASYVGLVLRLKRRLRS